VRVRVLAAALVAFAATVPAGQSAGHDPAWSVPATPHRVVADIHFVGTSGLGAFLIVTRDGYLLLDPGLDETVPLVRHAIESLGFRYEDVRVLLSTDAHAEHAGGLARVKRDTGARLEAMAADAALLESGGRGDFQFGDARSFPPVAVDRRLADGDVVRLGGVSLTARHTPGHTKGATTFVTIVTERGRAYQVVFAASTAIHEGTGLVDNPRYPGIVADWQRTYAILESLVADVWVSADTSVFDMPGKLSRIGVSSENPYVDPRGFRRHLADSRARFAARLSGDLTAR
jgi:metallo-beta-lactamase class B